MKVQKQSRYRARNLRRSPAVKIDVPTFPLDANLGVPFAEAKLVIGDWLRSFVNVEPCEVVNEQRIDSVQHHAPTFLPDDEIVWHPTLDPTPRARHYKRKVR